MTKLTVLKPIALAGQVYQAGDKVEVMDIREWEHITFVPSSIQAAVKAGALKDNGNDTYTVLTDAVFGLVGQLYKKGETFSVRKITDEGWTPVKQKEWVAKLIAAGAVQADGGVITIQLSSSTIQGGGVMGLDVTVAADGKPVKDAAASEVTFDGAVIGATALADKTPDSGIYTSSITGNFAGGVGHVIIKGVKTQVTVEPATILATPDANSMVESTSGVATFKLKVNNKVFKTATLKSATVEGAIASAGAMSVKNATTGQYQIEVTAGGPGAGAVAVTLTVEDASYAFNLPVTVTAAPPAA